MAVSWSSGWLMVTIWPSFIRCLMTSDDLTLILWASSATVMVSGTCTSMHLEFGRRHEIADSGRAIAVAAAAATRAAAPIAATRHAPVRHGSGCPFSWPASSFQVEDRFSDLTSFLPAAPGGCGCSSGRNGRLGGAGCHGRLVQRALHAHLRVHMRTPGTRLGRGHHGANACGFGLGLAPALLQIHGLGRIGLEFSSGLGFGGGLQEAVSAAFAVAASAALLVFSAAAVSITFCASTVMAGAVGATGAGLKILPIVGLTLFAASAASAAACAAAAA